MLKGSNEKSGVAQETRVTDSQMSQLVPAEIQAVELEDSTYKSKDLPGIDTYDDDFIFKTA